MEKIFFAHIGSGNFLGIVKDKKESYKFDQGVVSINLPQIAMTAKGEESKFWNLLDERLEICFEALMCRHYSLVGIGSNVSPIHWINGGISRLSQEDKIDKLLYNGYSSLSLGLIGVYEMTKIMKNQTYFEAEGNRFTLKVLKHIKDVVQKWKKETNISFVAHQMSSNSACKELARLDREKFGTIKDITDKGYYNGVYLIDEKEEERIFQKLSVQSEFQEILKSGISYIKIYKSTNLTNILRYLSDNIMFSKFIITY